ETSPAAHGRIFEGLTWKGFAFVALLCVVNGVRRMSPELRSGVDFIDWFTQLASRTESGLIVAVPVMLAVVAAYNLAPRRMWLRYAAVALALFVSSAAGVIAALAFETSVDCGVDCTPSSIGEMFVQAWVRYGAL